VLLRHQARLRYPVLQQAGVGDRKAIYDIGISGPQPDRELPFASGKLTMGVALQCP